MQQATNAATVGANTDGEEQMPRVSSELSLLINVHDVAALLKCSARHIWRLADAGKMPRPYKIGALRRWDRAVIKDWISEGCPNCRRGGNA